MKKARTKIIGGGNVKTIEIPFGAKREVEILSIDHYKNDGVIIAALALNAESEGYVLAGVKPYGDGLSVGDKTTIVFTKGGPKGGYWKFEHEA